MNNITVDRLSNNIPVIINHVPDLDTTGFGIFCRVGANCEDKDTNGISHFLEHMAFNGTVTRTSEQIRSEIANIGGMINAYTGREATVYHCSGLSTYAEKFINIVCENTVASTFPESSIEKERNVVLNEIDMYYDIPRHRLYDVVRSLTFPESQFGRPILGPAANIKKLSRQDIIDYVNRHYTNNKIVVSVVTGMAQGDIMDIIEKHLHSYENIAPENFHDIADTSNALQTPKHSHFIQHNMSQYNILISTSIDGYYDDSNISKQHMSRKVFASILGSGMNSRLFVELREKRGLCYDCRSHIEADSNIGMFMISTGTSSPEESIKIIDEQVNQPINKEEFYAAISSMKTNIAFKFEAIHDSFDIYGNEYLKFGKINSKKDYMDIIESIDINDVEQARISIAESNFITAAIGPKEIKI